MATPTNAFSTYETIGIREDLADVIYNIDPFETPVLTALGQGSVSNTFYEWQTDDLAAPAANAVIEGEDATIQATDPTVRLGNYTQISTKTVQTTGTNEAVLAAGRGSEMAYSMAKKGKELKTDLEFVLTGDHQARNAGSTSVARKTGNFSSYLKTNVHIGATGTLPTGDGTDVGTDGTAEVFTETLLKTQLENAWQEGGKPDTLFVPGDIKQLISQTFVGRATNVDSNSSDKSSFGVVDMYITDFGAIKVVPSRIIKSDQCLLLDTGMASVDYLRSFQSWDLAKTGDSEKKQIIVEYGLRVNNEKAHAQFRSVTAS
jgi:hypothetical protein